jgi:hypothetical protein
MFVFRTTERFQTVLRTELLPTDNRDLKWHLQSDTE